MLNGIDNCCVFVKLIGFRNCLSCYQSLTHWAHSHDILGLGFGEHSYGHVVLELAGNHSRGEILDEAYLRGGRRPSLDRLSLSSLPLLYPL